METKNYDEFFDELNDMANFKNFGEKKEGITNADGSRNWQANILLDNVKRLEQENAELRSTLQEIKAIAEVPKPFILKVRVDFLHSQSRNPKEDTVYITTSEHSIGGRAKCGVKNVSLGFDWENHQVRIEPENKLIKVESEG